MRELTSPPGDAAEAVDPLARIARDLLVELGEDPAREGLARTPDRVARALRFLTRGYRQSVAEVLNGAIFEEKHDEMVIVRDIDFHSLCEHHLLPFYGRGHIAYIPDGRIIGLSKLPRILDVFARRLQVQERLTQQVAASLQEVIQPLGVAVRGVEKQNAYATTSAMLGVFRHDRGTRAEFMNLLNRRV
jgi:GTP cyclohydrolase IA